MCDRIALHSNGKLNALPHNIGYGRSSSHGTTTPLPSSEKLFLEMICQEKKDWTYLVSYTSIGKGTLLYYVLYICLFNYLYI